jgi:hypothetical protein
MMEETTLERGALDGKLESLKLLDFSLKARCI